MNNDIAALLDESQTQFARVRAMYEDSLREQAVPAGLKVAIKNTLENQRSALEYLAHDVADRHGSAGLRARIYYPMAPDATRFDASIDRVMPGVRAAAPNVATVIRAHQPYQFGHEWLAHLRDLTNENKHQHLTPQTRVENRRVRAAAIGGGSVEWTPWNPATGGVKFGAGVSINGVPVDPVTQRPVPSRTQTVTEITYVDWLFEDLGVSALGVLQAIDAGLRSVIDDVAREAGL